MTVPLSSVHFEPFETATMATRTSHSTVVPQFGVAFEETILADATDDLEQPRDLEFHHGSNHSDDLWVVNRTTDSATILHETGTSNQWSDADGDGFADQANTSLSDDCPLEAGMSTEDRRGCPDADGDGVSDQQDDYPNDASRSVYEPVYRSVWFALLTLAVLAGSAVVLIRRKGGGPDLASAMNKDRNSAAPNQFPHLPMLDQGTAGVSMNPSASSSRPGESTRPRPRTCRCGGASASCRRLAPGWTMEQWNHYGERWLSREFGH